MTSGGQGRHERAQRGFTLVELMVTVTVLVVLLAIGVPSFSRLIASNRIAGQTNDLVGALQLARSEAVRRGQAVALRAANSGTHDYAGGWKVFTDADEDGAIPGAPSASDGSVLREQGAAAGALAIKRVTRSDPPAPFTYAESSAADRDFIVFNSRGASSSGSPAFFRVCDAGNRGVNGRIVQVTPVGRISLDSTSADC